jgi:hypothetical protein
MVVRDTILGEPRQIYSSLRFPRQCPLVLLVEVMHIIRINSNLTFMAFEGLHYSEILSIIGRAASKQNFDFVVERLPCERATWILGTNSEFALRPNTAGGGNLFELAVLRTFRMQTDF